MSKLTDAIDNRPVHEDEHVSTMQGTDWDRPLVLTPNPKGFWWVILGLAVMALGPMFGFLAGTTIPDAQAPWGLSPIWFGTMVGFLVAGVGVAMMVFGIRRWKNDPEAKARREAAEAAEREEAARHV